MCGIVGYSGIGLSNSDKLALLLYMNSEKRGGDNTGIYSKETGIIKSNQKAEEFLEKNGLPTSNLFIGHARKASVGSREAKNSHPFEYDGLVGVHNGTLENHIKMLEDSDYDYDLKDFDVDSQILYRLLADDNNTKDEVTDFKTLTKFIGAAALLFTDLEKPNRLYVYKTIDRPLYYGMIGESMYISSIEDGLKAIGCKEVKSFLSTRLYTIEDGKILSDKYYEQAKKVYSNYTGTKYTGYNPPIDKQPTRTSSYYQSMADEYNNEKYASQYKPIAGSSMSEKLSAIKSMSDINSPDLVGRWITPFSDYDKSYGSNSLTLTKDVWYFVTDSDKTNNYDITIVDDTKKSVSVNKYLFSSKSLDFKGFAIAMFDIIVDQVTLWKEDEIIEINDGNVKNRTIQLIHEATNRNIFVNVKYLRQASMREMKAAEDIKELNKDKQETEVDAYDIVELYNKEQADALAKKYDKSDDVSDKDDEISTCPFKDQDCEIFGADKVTDEDTPRDVEIIPEHEELEEEIDDDDKIMNLSTYFKVLDIIDDGLSEIGELINTTSFDELKERYETLKEVIQQSRDVEFVEENLD